jgi:hypothetical protein
VRGFWSAALLGALSLAIGCGGSGSASSASSGVAIIPTGTSIASGGTLNLSGTGPGGSAVTWAVSGPGTLIDGNGLAVNKTTPEYAVTYVAPPVSANTYAIVTATSTVGSSSSSYTPITILPPYAFGNIQPVTVNSGPSNQHFPNRAYTSVTVCSPGTITCRTIDGILVDTESVGLRVLASALPALAPLTDMQGNAIGECAQFVDQSYVWGTVSVADVRLNGELASPLSIQAIGDPRAGAVPADCKTGGAGIEEDTLDTLGANGILGVGLEPQDCGAACDPSAGGTPPSATYYSCAGGKCSPTFVPLSRQVAHPVVLFLTDNNGVELQLSPLTGAAPTVGGTLTFGIGTQINNQLVTGTVFPVDSDGNFTTNFAGQSLTASFLDSGLDGLFFPDATLPLCASPNSAFFCPDMLTQLSAVNIGANKTQSTIQFSVDNAGDLFNNYPSDAAFSMLAGPSGTGSCSGGKGACSFEWGLPFFYGRTVFVAINGQLPPIGINGQPPPMSTPNPPWWAYTTGFSK